MEASFTFLIHPPFWKQVRVLTLSNLRSRYRNTVAGFLWVVLNPICRFLAHLFVFHMILKIPARSYPIFLMAGLLPWLFLTQSLQVCSNQFIAKRKLVRSLPHHPLIYLLSQIIVNFIAFTVAFFLLLLASVFFGHQTLWGILWLPLASLPLIVGTVGLAWIIATLQVFYRDTSLVLPFFLNIFFFFTPVFYPLNIIPETFRWIIALNPIYLLIQPFRSALIDFDLYNVVQSLLCSTLVATFIIFAALIFWEKRKNLLNFHV